VRWRAAGAGSLVVGTVAVVVLGWATVRRVLDIRWWAVLVPLIAAGFIAGAGWRVMTAGVAGANIGAGFVVLLGGPVVLVLLACAWPLPYICSPTRTTQRTRPSTRAAGESMPGDLAVRGE
jgi:hypothetical protein